MNGGKILKYGMPMSNRIVLLTIGSVGLMVKFLRFFGND